jgi:uncharacterized radical SAM superfamily Fe-S cluster-containing enzyme
MASVGIGLTNNCNLHCAHCYRDQGNIYNLSLEDIKEVCDSLEIGSIGFGTGENGLNPQYLEIVEYLRARGIRLTLASNGYTISITPDEMLRPQMATRSPSPRMKCSPISVMWNFPLIFPTRKDRTPSGVRGTGKLL